MDLLEFLQFAFIFGSLFLIFLFVTVSKIVLNACSNLVLIKCLFMSFLVGYCVETDFRPISHYKET